MEDKILLIFITTVILFLVATLSFF